MSLRTFTLLCLLYIGYCKESGEKHLKILTQSIGSMLVSEIGDKTFFLAAILSMKFNRLAVFAGATAALVLMTGISCAFGIIVPTLLPRFYTAIVVTIIFYFFGAKLLFDWYHMENDGDKEELKQVEMELEELDKKLLSSHKIIDPENPSEGQKSNLSAVVPIQQIIWQAFIMTFLGEWGDRSQITTISLSAVQDTDIVFLGCSLGHLMCTTIAILGGKLLANQISEKTVNLVGGIVFIIFGLMHTYDLMTGHLD
ncbi:unnamed protein product (macronuclear) [Paramecium tetraurelia]|uniref:GDT1 family protein n=1 Tax=Paramecium tetraurelia TaxID=5888 RepID=A0BST2_PARTE|nr:uncharacterized protein GSPATT00031831001 [Paramecium tetraurelia]CAK61599.1 unnamed protein product [Paramecium tetraurelia]|eukprot:XP_001428997.1 hypothetical protein (macronuclear) [Paramecium tetraurelia strain d4-2]